MLVRTPDDRSSRVLGNPCVLCVDRDRCVQTKISDEKTCAGAAGVCSGGEPSLRGRTLAQGANPRSEGETREQNMSANFQLVARKLCSSQVFFRARPPDPPLIRFLVTTSLTDSPIGEEEFVAVLLS